MVNASQSPETAYPQYVNYDFKRYAGIGVTATPPDVYPPLATTFAAVCAVIFCIVGVAGNAVTALALVRCARLRRHATTAFVLGLCASDLLFCSVCLPLTAARYAQRAWRLGPALCRLFAFLFYGNVAASLLSMVAITLNRLVLVAWRAHYERLFRAPRAALLAATCWLLGFAPMLLPLAGAWGRLGLHARTFSCTVLPARPDATSPKKVLFVAGFLVPCAIIAASYTAIYCRVRSSRRALLSHSLPATVAAVPGAGATGGAALRREDGRLTRLMLSIFCCFLLCFLPLMLVNVADDEIRFPTLHVLASILAWASAVVNPFVYAASNRQYREAYRRVLCVRHRRRRPAAPARRPPAEHAHALAHAPVAAPTAALAAAPLPRSRSTSASASASATGTGSGATEALRLSAAPTPPPAAPPPAAPPPAVPPPSPPPPGDPRAAD